MRRLLALALLLAGCATDTIRVRVGSALDQAEIDTLLYDAENILGVPIEQVDHVQGAIVIDIHEAYGSTAGRVLVKTGCKRAVWAEPSAEYIAHEIGHALHLDHVCEDEGMGGAKPCTPDDRKYLMYPSGTGSTELTDDEQATIEHQARLLSLCPQAP